MFETFNPYGLQINQMLEFQILFHFGMMWFLIRKEL